VLFGPTRLGFLFEILKIYFMTKSTYYTTSVHPKTLVIVVHAPYNIVRDVRGYFDEFLHLVRSNGISIDAVKEVKLRSVDNTAFFTKGKLEEIIEMCRHEQFEEVIISEQLSVRQERTLAELLHVKLFDRTMLILEIFEKRATSAEGKIQVQMARLRYTKSRLAGRGIHLSQQGGMPGTRGPGETQKARDIEHIEHLLNRLRRELDAIERSRATQRKRRLNKQEDLICLVGYTNAGKSSILNVLTKSNVMAENQLFSTLDTTTRELYLRGIKCGLLSDTVGFIQQLPKQLLEAFKSTLQELHFAHLILHVVDASDPNWRSHITIVDTLLADLAVAKPLVYVFNKVDKLTAEERLALCPYLPTDHPVIMCSTQAGLEGLAELIAFLYDWHQNRSVITSTSVD
jgi:GTP-binding protein HflX